MKDRSLNPDQDVSKDRLAFLNDKKVLKRMAFYYIVTAQVIGVVGVIWFFTTF